MSTLSKRNMQRNTSASHQRGITLIIVMILLVLISIASTSAIRSAANSEGVSNSARTQSLAFQAAEAGLAHCENIVRPFLQETLRYNESVRVNGTTTLTVSPMTGGFVIQPAPIIVAGVDIPYLWKDIANTWDGATSTSVVTAVPLTSVNAPTSSTNIYAAYQRGPECLAQYSAPGNVGRVVITARGFGPEVAAATGKPVGSESWVQVVIQASL